MSTVAPEQRRTEYHRLLPALLTSAEPYGEADRLPRSTRDWIVDVLAFLLSLVGILLTWLGQRGSSHSESHYMLAADFVVGGLAALSIWLRRRWPVALILVLTPISLVFQFAGFASIIAFFTVAVHRRFPIAVLVTVLQLLSLFPLYLLHPQPGLSYWGSVLVGSIFIVAVLAWGMFVRARRQLLLSLRERADRAEATQQLKVEQAQHLERERIAREMHDVLAHRISLLSLHAGALEFHPDAPPEEIARAAGIIRGSARQALQDLREVIGVLRDGGQDGDSPERPQPTLADIPGLVDESRAAGMRVKLVETISDPDALPAGVGRSAYRIVQEGLTNVRKHAPGSLAYVTIAGTSGAGLDIEVRNLLPVGRMASTDLPGSGNGIIGLTERVSLAGGQIDCGPTNAGEYRLHTWLPWPSGETA